VQLRKVYTFGISSLVVDVVDFVVGVVVVDSDGCVGAERYSLRSMYH